MKKHVLFFTLICLGIFSFPCSAQDDLMKMAQSQSKDSSYYTIATFKSTRLINQATLECLGERTLDFRISHRFGVLNSGSYNAWGIDGPTNIRIGLDYSFDGKLMAGIGRTSLGPVSPPLGPPSDKLIDAFLKYSLLRQTENNKMPISLTLFTSIDYTAVQNQLQQNTGQEIFPYSSDRYSFAHEIMVGRKFSPRFSLQLSGFLVHNNLAINLGDKNDVYAVGGAARYKITKSFSIAAEYATPINDYSISPDNFHNSFGIGIEIETGGHVFQIFLTNSFGITETQFVPYTTSKWTDAGIHLGFNISRVFPL